MKQVLIDRYGAPHETARCAEVSDVGAPCAECIARISAVGAGVTAESGNVRRRCASSVTHGEIALHRLSRLMWQHRAAA